MINKQPSKLFIEELKGGFNKIYITTSASSDADLLGRAFWYRKVGTSSYTLVKTDVLTNKYSITGLQPNTEYEVLGAFYDTMVDDSMLEVRALVDLSDPYFVTTRLSPIILAITSERVDVDIGVTLPNVTFKIDGEADTLIIQYKEEGTSNWVDYYSGASLSSITFPAPKLGNFRFRCKGIVYTNGGLLSEESSYVEFDSIINLGFNLTNPSAPSVPSILIGKVNDTFERYDAKLSWTWNKGTGPGLKAFVVEYTSLDDFNTNGFSNAKTISIGNATSSIIPNFPFGIPHKIRVAAYSFGAIPNNVAYSPVLSFELTSSTSLDTSFTKSTLVDISYSGIYGYRLEDTVRISTFSMDAATGNLGIGTPTSGVYPIQLNGTDGSIVVDGSIIAKKINAASFVLTNFTGRDNPALYSEGKNFGSSTAGIWTGYDNTSGVYKFDIGNASNYMRWDGTDLVISGGVKIGTALGNLDIGEVIGKNTVWVYTKAVTRPATPTGTSYPPSGWSTSPVAITLPNELVWTSQGILNEITGELDTGTSWGLPIQFSGTAGTDGTNGISSFKSIVFLRSNTKPSIPTGGSYLSPVPAGWSDGAPDGTTILWMSSRVFSSNGSAPQESTWSAISQMTDTASQEIRYSSNASPGDPTNNPVNWSTTANASTIWMAIRNSYNGVWNAWAVSKIKGENGENGATGPQGVPGTPGANGQTLYTWIKYADTVTGTGINNDPSGKEYIGFAYNKATATESNTASDYTWSLIQGPQGNTGVAGAPGADGQTTYTWIKYANVADGTGLYDTPTSATKYIGIAVNKTTATESTVKTDYTWSQFRGENGATGATGAPGTPGLPGANGQRGSGFYVIATSTGVWSDSVANSAVPGGSPVKDDVVTIFKQTDTKISVTKRYSGTVWVLPGLVLHGDMIATGTISGDRIVANTSITAPKIIGGEISIGGASGTFDVSTSGSVSIKSGTTGARMEVKNDQILVYNDSGVLVVKLGRLS